MFNFNPARCNLRPFPLVECKWRTAAHAHRLTSAISQDDPVRQARVIRPNLVLSKYVFISACAGCSCFAGHGEDLQVSRGVSSAVCLLMSVLPCRFQGVPFGCLRRPCFGPPRQRPLFGWELFYRGGRHFKPEATNLRMCRDEPIWLFLCLGYSRVVGISLQWAQRGGGVPRGHVAFLPSRGQGTRLGAKGMARLVP